MNATAERILATGATVSAILISLTGGLALVVRSLRHTDLSLSLSLERAPDAGARESSREGSSEDVPSPSPVRVRR